MPMSFWDRLRPRPLERRARDVWTGGTRTWVEARPVPRGQVAAFAGAVAERMVTIESVAWARYNAPLGRVVVQGRDTDVDALLSGVVELERRFDLVAPFPEDERALSDVRVAAAGEDALLDAMRRREREARQPAWLAFEAELASHPGAHPASLPERESTPSRARESSGTATWERVGHSAFAASLGAWLAERGLLVLDRGALPRLASIHTLLLDVPPAQCDPFGEVAEALLRAAHGVDLPVVSVGAHVPALRAQQRGGSALEVLRALRAEERGVLAVSAVPALVAAADVAATWRGSDASFHADVVAPDLAGLTELLRAIPAARAFATQRAAMARIEEAAARLTAIGAPLRRVLLRRSGATGIAARAALEAPRALASASAQSPPWHAMSPDAVLRRLDTRRGGLRDAEVRARREGVTHGGRSRKAASRFPGVGVRTLARVVRPGALARSALSRAPFSPRRATRAAGGIAAGVALDAVLLGGAVALRERAGEWLRERSERALAESFEAHEAQPRARVRRGRVQRVRAEDLVVGDVIELEEGEVLVADVRILEARGLAVDESALTDSAVDEAALPGPRGHVSKDAVACEEMVPRDERRSMLYAGSRVVSGTAVAVVTATGGDTEAARAGACREAGAAVALEGAGNELETELARLTRRGRAYGGLADLVHGASALAGDEAADALGGLTLSVALAPTEGELALLCAGAQRQVAERLSEVGIVVRRRGALALLGRLEVLCLDPSELPAAGASEATATLRQVGCELRWLTRAPRAAARSLAGDLGLGDVDLCDGAELDAMSDDELRARVATTEVFCGLEASRRARIVSALRASGRIVGVGAMSPEDAPSLRRADVGIALFAAEGAAREAAELVVPSGDVMAIARAVREARALERALWDAASLRIGADLAQRLYQRGERLATGALGQRVLLALLTAAPASAVAFRRPREGSGDAPGDGGIEEALLLDAAVAAALARATRRGARMLGDRRGADALGLMVLAGAQLGHSLGEARRDPALVLVGVVAAAALIALVQTPATSLALGLRPLGPLGLASAAGASALGAFLPAALRCDTDRSGDALDGRALGSRAQAQAQADAGET